MNTYLSRALLLLTGVSLFYTSYALPLPPRATLWGFAGSDVLGRGDVMLPLFGNDRQILWTDAQGKYGEEGTWLRSLSAGYRQIAQNQQIFGIYGFMDYNISSRGNAFWVASPGIES